MNGVRSTFKRKGYLLTALAAAVLLAASPGTAEAQQGTGVTITGPAQNTIHEGGTATYTVTVRGYVAAAVDADDPADGIQNDEAVAANTLTVSLGAPTVDSTNAGTEGELTDLNSNLHVLSAVFNTPRNTSTVPLLFTQSKTISVVTLHDNDAENEAFTLAFALSGAGGLVTTAAGVVGTDDIALATGGTAANPTSLTIDDDETQTYTLALTPGQAAAPKEGVQFTVDLKASPAHEDGTGNLNVLIDKRTGWTLGVEGAVSPATSTTVNAANPTRVISITQTAGDRNRVTDTVTVSAHTGVTGASMEQASLSIDVADANVLQAVTAMVVNADGVALAPQPTSVEEGESVKIAVMPVDKDGKVTPALENLEIALASSGSADAADFQLSGTVKITAGQNNSNVVDLMVETDEDVGMETIVLDATVSGDASNGTETSTNEGVLSLDIMDATEKKIEPKATDDAYPSITGPMNAAAGDDGLNPGESFEVMTGDLFTVMDGYTASYSASVSGSAVSVSTSGETVTIEAVMAGESEVTVTGTAQASSTSLMPSQTVSNVASVTFPVEVVDKDLVIMLEMPSNVMDGNIVEGMSYDIIASANRMITEAEGSVEVMIMRDRAQSDADDSDFTVGNATIMAGSDSATAELMVTEDNMPDAGTDDNMGEQLVLYGEVDGEAINSLTFTIWDQAVPALPLIGQLVLALLMALGGARLYRRRQG